MITHYGLFWYERHVFWGRQRVAGSLQGKVKEPLERRGAPTREERSQVYDFRSYIGLYCLFAGYSLLYTGEAGLGTNRTLFDRLKQHRTGPLSGRWDRFSWFGRDSADGDVPVTVSIQQLEAVVIAITNPGLNRQAGSFGDAVQVYQVPDEAAEGDIETKIDLILRHLEIR